MPRVAPTSRSGFASGSFDVPTENVAANNVRPAALKPQKMDCHGQNCSSTPELNMPATPPHPATPAQMATALERCRRG
jgi:hypothetical protein